MKANNEYYQSNALVQARTKKYGIIEHRLFRMAVADLNPKLKNSVYYDKEFPTFKLPTEELIKEFGEDKNDHRIYEKLLAAYRNMIQSYVEIGDPKHHKLYPIFSEINFTVKDGLTIQFSPKMKPFLLDFENGNYTRCFLQLAFELSSKYSLILLELMLQYRGMKKGKVIERRLTPEELKFALDVKDDAYELMHDFVKKVINPAIREINEKTNYYINPDYKIERGRWRKIKAFVFTLILPNADKEGVPKAEPKKEAISAPVASPKSQTETTSLSKITPSDFFTANSEDVKQREPKTTRKKLVDFTEEEAYALAKLLRFKISEKVAFETLEKFGVKAIDWAVENYQTAKERGVAINNPAGFILDKVQEFEEVGFVAEDIFKLVEKFKAQKNAQIMKEREEAERKEAEEQELKAAIEEARLKIRNQYTEKEIDELIDILAKEYEISDRVFTESICEQLDKYGITKPEILRRYLQHHYRR